MVLPRSRTWRRRWGSFPDIHRDPHRRICGRADRPFGSGGRSKRYYLAVSNFASGVPKLPDARIGRGFLVCVCHRSLEPKAIRGKLPVWAGSRSPWGIRSNKTSTTAARPETASRVVCEIPRSERGAGERNALTVNRGVDQHARPIQNRSMGGQFSALQVAHLLSRSVAGLPSISPRLASRVLP